jgi:hypothetical protein
MNTALCFKFWRFGQNITFENDTGNVRFVWAQWPLRGRGIWRLSGWVLTSSRRIAGDSPRGIRQENHGNQGGHGNQVAKPW